METELLPSTSLRSGTKAYHHAQNMLRIALLCQAQLVPFVLRKRSKKMTRKRGQHLTACKSSLATQKAPAPHFPNDRPNAFQKMSSFVTVKKQNVREEGPRCVQEEGRKRRGKNTSSPPLLFIPTQRISHVLIPLFPSGTNEVINQSHGPTERGKRGPEAHREQS